MAIKNTPESERIASTISTSSATGNAAPVSRLRKIGQLFAILFFLAALLSVLGVFVSSFFTPAPVKHNIVSSNNSGTSPAIDTAKKTAATQATEDRPLVEATSDWAKLTPIQQKILAPLAPNWSKLKPATRNKWLEISQHYAAMKPAEQARVRERMHDWVDLSPKERQIVRENYARNSQLDTEQRAERWVQYQQLSDEAKQKLAAQAPPQEATKRVTAPAPIIEKSMPANPINLSPPDPILSPDEGLKHP
ncbi:DUF3106 domain-containing protein [Glaciimonas soli]|uniref:DUF3106 domain-containing protein n=1 Tax=Glaciimonas soli TaxID=2590999 RepID=A0A843YWX9_9BURK|nr:DUF3106 domain-containing protein [Glaciimonas soli]MQR01998.1 DUF3106 domain-containing protein [Glaciimonas soli]